MRFRKSDTLIYVTVALFVASLIRKDFLPIFGFSLGFLLGNFNKVEKWINLKERWIK